MSLFQIYGFKTLKLTKYNHLRNQYDYLVSLAFQV